MVELIYKEEVHRVVGCAMEVMNSIGHGLSEKVYENALVVEFGLRHVPVWQQPQFPVIYKTVEVGKYVPDLICFEKLIVDTKTVDSLTDRELGQMLNDLKVSGLPVGVLINFKRPRIEWRLLCCTTIIASKNKTESNRSRTNVRCCGGHIFRRFASSPRRHEFCLKCGANSLLDREG